MTKMFKNAALAAALAVAPFAANATTVLNDGDSNTIGTGDSFSFQLSSSVGDTGDTLEFTFVNGSATNTQVAVTLATVAQFLASYTNGVSFEWSEDGASMAFAQGDPNTGGSFNTSISAGGTSVLSVTYGDVIAGGSGPIAGDTADIDFFIAAVPLPAGGLLLLSAFGAVAVARRKKA